MNKIILLFLNLSIIHTEDILGGFSIMLRNLETDKQYGPDEPLLENFNLRLYSKSFNQIKYNFVIETKTACNISELDELAAKSQQWIDKMLEDRHDEKNVIKLEGVPELDYDSLLQLKIPNEVEYLIGKEDRHLTLKDINDIKKEIFKYLDSINLGNNNEEHAENIDAIIKRTRIYSFNDDNWKDTDEEVTKALMKQDRDKYMMGNDTAFFRQEVTYYLIYYYRRPLSACNISKEKLDDILANEKNAQNLLTPKAVNILLKDTNLISYKSYGDNNPFIVFYEDDKKISEPINLDLNLNFQIPVDMFIKLLYFYNQFYVNELSYFISKIYQFKINKLATTILLLSYIYDPQSRVIEVNKHFRRNPEFEKLWNHNKKIKISTMFNNSYNNSDSLRQAEGLFYMVLCYAKLLFFINKETLYKCEEIRDLKELLPVSFGTS